MRGTLIALAWVFAIILVANAVSSCAGPPRTVPKCGVQNYPCP